MKNYLTPLIGIVFLISLSSISSAQWWNPFSTTPKDYEDCAEQAAKEARSKAALTILLESCSQKYQGRRHRSGGYLYYDSRTEMFYKIDGPNPTKKEFDWIELEYKQYLKKKREAAQKNLDKRNEYLAQQEHEKIKREQIKRTALNGLIKISHMGNWECSSYNSNACKVRIKSVRLKNNSSSLITGLSAGWIVSPSSCPSSLQSKDSFKIQIAPNATADLEIDVIHYFNRAAEKPEFCFVVTDVSLE